MSKDKPEQSAEEIVGLIISNTASQYSEEWKPDTIYTKEDLIKIVQSYANQEVKKACEKQSGLCSTIYYNESINLNGTWSQGIKEKIKNAPSPQD